MLANRIADAKRRSTVSGVAIRMMRLSDVVSEDDDDDDDVVSKDGGDDDDVVVVVMVMVAVVLVFNAVVSSMRLCVCVCV